MTFKHIYSIIENEKKILGHLFLFYDFINYRTIKISKIKNYFDMLRILIFC